MATPDPLRALSFAPIKPHINRNILLYTPPTSTGEDAAAGGGPSPKVIILTTWFGGATSGRIAVYCRAYQRLYPQTPILIVRTQVTDYSLANRQLSAVQARLSPAHKYISSLFPITSPPSSESSGHRQEGALLHIFSNGGCATALQLGKMLRRSSRGEDASHLPIPFVGLILDSCPGMLAFDNIYAAASMQIPQSQPLYSIGRAILWPYIKVYVAMQRAGIVTSSNDVIRDLNDSTLFGLGPRLFLFSKTDTVIAADDIAAHAKQAAELGFDVRTEVWEDAVHCALPMADSQRYWNAVEAFTSRALSGRKAKL
jgi:hypothetical protein